jgi:hypothetical protein
MPHPLTNPEGTLVAVAIGAAGVLGGDDAAYEVVIFSQPDVAVL